MVNSAPTRGYMTPDTTEKPIACEWPRQYRELSLPISANHTGTIYLPQHMTEQEWQNVMDYLAVVRTVAIDRRGAPINPDKEAGH